MCFLCTEPAEGGLTVGNACSAAGLCLIKYALTQWRPPPPPLVYTTVLWPKYALECVI